MPVPDVRRLLRGSPRIEISQPPEGQDSLAAGKNAGNLSDSAVFSENLSRERLRIQWFASEFPTLTGQGIFLPAQGIIRAGREWQGISRKTDPLAPTHPITPKWLIVVDKKIINNWVRFRCGRTRLASPTGRAGMRVSSPRSNPQTCMTRLKRSA